MTDRKVTVNERCRCSHSWEDHDGMGDCTHLDRRTLTGLCEGCRATEGTT